MRPGMRACSSRSSGAPRRRRRASRCWPCAPGRPSSRSSSAARADATASWSTHRSSRRGGDAVIARALAAVLIFASVAAAPDADVRVDAQRHAAAAGAVGTVTGHAWEERRKPGGVAQPLGGAVVTLVPHSSALTAQLEGIRTRSRDSATAYRASARAIRLAREAYEKALWEAGAADLVRTSVVDTTGGFRVDLPAGCTTLRHE